MGASATLSATGLTVEAGRAASLDVLVRNNGSVVDEVTLGVLGEMAPWASVEPPALSLFPGGEGRARVTFAPPRSSLPRAGTYDFGVMVSSREDPEGSTVEEGSIEVVAFSDTVAELIPHAGRARHSARYRLAVDNRGNVPLACTLAGADAGGAVILEVRPKELDVPAGATMFARVTATTSHWIWKGSPQTLPFAILARPGEEAPIRCEGSLLHEAVFPPWLPRALMALAALVAAAVAVWYGLLRPNIRSQARAVARQQSAKAVASAHKALMASQHAANAAAAAQRAAGSAAQAATKATGKVFATTTTTIPAGPLTTATGGRVALSVAPGQTASSSLAGIPKKDGFELTDVVFENPDGDAGTVSLMRGSSVVLFENLSNFRDLDFHFVSPVSFPAGTPVTLSATCANPTTAKLACQPAAYLGGYLG